jgi:oligoribonuclease
MSSRFLWIDLETTGLDPHKGSVLEVAVVGADDDDPAMPVLAQWDMRVSASAHEYSQADDFVRNMHHVNGLWDACASLNAMSRAAVEGTLCDFVRGDRVDMPKGVVLAGGSVHFDLAWVRVHFPTFARCLSHRVLDVSTLKACERTWGQPFEDIKTTEHRALSDVMASIAEARALRARRWA